MFYSERFTTDIIGTSAFGLGCNSFKEPDSPFRLKAMKFFRLTRLGALRTAFVNNCPNLARTLTFRTISKDVGDFFGKVIEDTVNYRENNGVVRRDFLQLLIDIKNGVGQEENGEKGDKKTLTMSEIAAQSFIFFLAGYETSSATMTFALYQLAINPDIQDRVREEIETVLSKHNGEMTYEAVTEFKYMEQVINETLRLYPPLPMILRSCSADYKVPGENLVIEKGTRVHIPVMGIHYDEEYYENPYCFDPDRFSEENKKKIKKYTYMPFGEGPRICIGMRFGLMQSKIGLASILRKFRVTLNERTKLPLTFCKTSVFINAEGGVWLNLEKIRS
ncbi:hypothetical protein NQ318_005481 [Aromia moschata]|uniref:Cytochrome P450 n=1 Tax=Aromia moschata TaxID=1265417 RepID=A0AAV8XPK7_9CUCU|nr:hypothetical protein NQ318_005481 [Aromia moschata]